MDNQIENKKGVSDFPTFENNPFHVIGLETKSIKEDPEGKTMVDESTGEYLKVINLGKNELKVFDNVKYTKLYDESISILKDFSSPTLKVWCYILTQLKPTKDEVVFNMQDCIKFTGYTASINVYKGITELLEKNYIARSIGKGGTYFINPNLFFNGDRRKIQNNLVI
jgi:hypothetical protein